MNLHTNKVIFSVCRNDKPFEFNNAVHSETLKLLQSKGLNPLVLVGQWQGQKESSFLLESTDYNEYERLCNLAKGIALEHGQACVLEVANDNTATFIDPTTGTAIGSGVWSRAEKDHAEQLGDFSYFPDDGSYWVVE